MAEAPLFCSWFSVLYSRKRALSLGAVLRRGRRADLARRTGAGRANSPVWGIALVRADVALRPAALPRCLSHAGAGRPRRSIAAAGGAAPRLRQGGRRRPGDPAAVLRYVRDSKEVRAGALPARSARWTRPALAFRRPRHPGGARRA